MSISMMNRRKWYLRKIKALNKGKRRNKKEKKEEKKDEKAVKAAVSPLVQQYLDLKKKHPDAILLFRCGDFYELPTKMMR